MHFNMKKIRIGNRLIGEGEPVFIIGELSCNHNRDFDLALKTIDAMYEAGVDCVKLQTSTPDSITIDCDKDVFKIKGGTLWDDRTLYDLYKETYTPWEWHKPIKKYVEEKGLVFFSSPFDFKAVDFLEALEVPAYKIASFEITDIPLIEYTASKGKPIIISTGIASKEDINDAVEACLKVGNEQIILLKCTSSYPTPWDEVNLNLIPKIANDFNVQVGLSDHTLGSIVPMGAVSLGAKVIEKHFILDRKIGGPDASFSMEPIEFKQMINDLRVLEQTLGLNDYRISERVEKNRQFARSLFIVEDVKKGDKISNRNVRSIRPGFGLMPKLLPKIIGMYVTQDIERGTPLKEEYLTNDAQF